MISFETKHMRNAMWSRVHQISARYHFPELVSCQTRVFMANQLNSFALAHRIPQITVTAFIAHRSIQCKPQITVTSLIVRWVNNAMIVSLEYMIGRIYPSKNRSALNVLRRWYLWNLQCHAGCSIFCGHGIHRHSMKLQYWGCFLLWVCLFPKCVLPEGLAK